MQPENSKFTGEGRSGLFLAHSDRHAKVILTPTSVGFPSKPDTPRRLGNGSARTPKKGVASCDKPRVGVCSLRTGDPLMGLPVVDPSGFTALRREREPPERKHLSKGRKRNQLGFP